MRRVWLITMLVALGSSFAAGQQAKAPGPAAAVKPVKVYAARSGVKKPRLLPMDPALAIMKKCKDNWDGETELSLLVDEKGEPHNIMFLQPAGSPVDWFAIAIAERDRFEPGTLKSKPVVVAETLRMKLKTCIVEIKNPEGKLVPERVLRAQPKQKLIRPKNPPTEATFVPVEAPPSKITRKVTRPDFFGGSVTAPVLLYSTDASYTPLHKGAKIRGVCQVSLVVDAHGLPRDLHILKSLDPGLDRSALEAVSMYRFFPAIKDNDEPVPAAIVVDVKFAPPAPNNVYYR